MATETDVRVTDVDVSSFENSDGEILVDKVKFIVPDAPNDQITMKPRTTETAVHEKDGFETKEVNTVRYDLDGFLEDYENIKEAQKATKLGKEVRLKALVSKYDQSKDENVEGDETYAYIDRSHNDTLELVVKSDESASDEAE